MIGAAFLSSSIQFNGRTLLQVIQEKNAALGQDTAACADLRFGSGAGGEICLLNKYDGAIRLVGN